MQSEPIEPVTPQPVESPDAPPPFIPPRATVPKHPAFKDFIDRLTGKIVSAFHIGSVDKSKPGTVTLLPPAAPAPQQHGVSLPVGVANAINPEPGQVLVQLDDGSFKVLTALAFSEVHGLPEDPYAPIVPPQAVPEPAPAEAQASLDTKIETPAPEPPPEAEQPATEVHESN